MEPQDIKELNGFDKFEFEGQQMGWDMLLSMMRNRSKDTKGWRLVQRIKDVRALYFNLIKKGTTVNTNISAQIAKQVRKKPTGKGSASNELPSGKVLRFQDDT